VAFSAKREKPGERLLLCRFCVRLALAFGKKLAQEPIFAAEPAVFAPKTR
jgi:hypothetical protein